MKTKVKAIRYISNSRCHVDEGELGYIDGYVKINTELCAVVVLEATKYKAARFEVVPLVWLGVESFNY